MIFNKLNRDNQTFTKYFFINEVCCRLFIGETALEPCKCKPKCLRIAKKSNAADLVISRQSCNFVLTLGKRLLLSGTLWRNAGFSIWKEISIHDFVVYWTLTASQVACQPKAVHALLIRRHFYLTAGASEGFCRSKHFKAFCRMSANDALCSFALFARPTEWIQHFFHVVPVFCRYIALK